MPTFKFTKKILSHVHSVHCGINPSQKHHPLFLAKHPPPSPLNLQTVQAHFLGILPIFRHILISLVTTEQSILVYKLFLSLNIPVFGLFIAEKLQPP